LNLYCIISVNIFSSVILPKRYIQFYFCLSIAFLLSCFLILNIR
jgi:hypothetical protein